MRKNVRIISLTVFLISFLASCNNDFEDELDNTDSAITFRTTIVNESQTRVTGSSWDSGDAIGIYMKEADSNLSESSIVNGFKNIKYTTSGNGIFTSSAIPLYYPEDNRKVDFIAYYPYKNLNENTYPIDVSDQSSPQSIDFIYANNARGFNKTYNNPSFVFYRQLSKIRLNIKPRTGGISVEDITVKIVGMKTKASFDLAQGTISVDETSGTDIPMKLSESSDGRILAEAVILPLVHTGNCRIVFTYSGKDYTWYVPSSTEFKKGYKYAYDIELKADGSIVIPKPSEGWFETPLLTTNDNIIYVSHRLPDNPEVRNYSLLYDQANRFAYWVAYPLHASYIGSTKRTNAWGYDPQINLTWQPLLSKGFGITNTDRGHQIPSADRTSSREANMTTFYYSNMTAQNSQLNQGMWAELEKQVRVWTYQCDTMYVVTGAMITTKTEASITYVKDNEGKQVARPKYYYKALAKKSGSNYYTIAFKMNNEKPEDTNYNSYRMSVAQLEEETGFTFFPTLTNEEKSNIEASKWQ